MTSLNQELVCRRNVLRQTHRFEARTSRDIDHQVDLDAID